MMRFNKAARSRARPNRLTHKFGDGLADMGCGHGRKHCGLLRARDRATVLARVADLLVRLATTARETLEAELDPEPPVS